MLTEIEIDAKNLCEKIVNKKRDGWNIEALAYSILKKIYEKNYRRKIDGKKILGESRWKLKI